VWSDIYPSVGLPQLIVSAVLTVYDPSGTLLGVIGVDFSLDDISQFLESLDIGQSGQAFVMDSDGLLVATSTGEKPYQVKPDDTLTRIAAIDSGAPLTQQTAQFLARTVNINDLREHAQLDFKEEIQSRKRVVTFPINPLEFSPRQTDTDSSKSAPGLETPP
jgi:hypothetical protein